MRYYYCFSSIGNLFRSEIEYAKEKGMLIFYNSQKDIFLDKDGNQLDIKGMNIFPRCSIGESIGLLKAIERNGGKSIITIDEYFKTLNWPYYIKSKRNNIILSGEEIINNPNLLSDIFGEGRVFFKTKLKNFGGIVDISSFFNKNSSLYLALNEHLDEDFIISSYVNIEKDLYGPLEYRAFVINGELFNVSRTSNQTEYVIPNEVMIKLKNMISFLSGTDFPDSYVVDLFLYKDSLGNIVVDVLGCNPIIASEKYLFNSIFEKKASMIKKDRVNVFNDKNVYNYGLGSSISSLFFYSLSGGFAADLISFSLFGVKSNDDVSDYDKNSNVRKLSRIKEESCSQR